jgi:hypothetical protein
MEKKKKIIYVRYEYRLPRVSDGSVETSPSTTILVTLRSLILNAGMPPDLIQSPFVPIHPNKVLEVRAPSNVTASLKGVS